MASAVRLFYFHFEGGVIVKNKFRSLLAILLAFVMVAMMVGTSTVNAAIVSDESVGATQSEAVNWVNSKIGTWIGSGQCVALINAYANYLGLTISGGNGNACDYTGATNISGTTRINNYSGFVPQPGDICVWGSYARLHSDYQTNYYGHIGIVLSADSSNMVTVECNLDYPYEGGVCKKVTQNRPTSYVTCFIRPIFTTNGGGKHTHNYSTYVYYWKAHPHYSCYKCSCGDVKERTNETRPISTCSQCLAEYKPNASIDKSVYEAGENVTVNWNKISKATHYNVRLYKIGSDGNGSLYATTYNITDTNYTFSLLTSGEYYLYVQTYNKNYWTVDGSDYFHSQGEKISFSVVDEYKPTASAEFERNNYEYYNYNMTWHEALKFCEKRGGHLAVINSEDENEFAYNLSKDYSNYVWLGGTDDGKEGNWYWINSDSFSYTNWNGGEPNNSDNNENCMELITIGNSTGKWNDVPNDISNVGGFICEYENQPQIDIDKYSSSIDYFFNNSFYEVYDYNVDWQTAKKICEKKGGHLIVIDSKSENEEIGKAIQKCGKDEYWLGISDYEDEGDWKNVKGESVSYTNWTSGEPSNSWNVEDYAVIKKSSLMWNDLKEYSGLYRSVGFICEYDNGIDFIKPSTVIEESNHKYELFDYSVTWTQAYKICEKKGGHLVSVTSSNENDLLMNLMQQYSKSRCWLGGTLFNKGTWYWTNGEPFDYTNWNTGEPNNENNIEYYTCMIITSTTKGKWNDSYIDPTWGSSCFICEYDDFVDEKIYEPIDSIIYGNYIYELYDYNVDWQTAKKICEKKGGTLATIENNQENEALKNLMESGNKNEYWLGLTDIGNEGYWKWIDNNISNYSNWMLNNPENDLDIEDYAAISKSTGQWNDLKGFSSFYRSVGFICKKRIHEIGDTNLDGNVNICDVTAIQRHLAEIELLTEVQLDLADTNGDGEINISDATHLQKYLAGFDGIVLGKT